MLRLSARTVMAAARIPVFNTVASYREWRTRAAAAGQTVGCVPTMGALHDGHLALVRQSLAQNDLTVVSIFVNPAQFAPHEDLATYPRTFETDIHLLHSTSVDAKSPAAVFAPTVSEMYPNGIVQDISQQKGTFVEVKGFSHQMEGVTRPTFFRGVATVVLKLLNVLQPTSVYFGQKDIQQALILRRMWRDLLLAYPSPTGFHIVPTSRDPVDGLALSSRNAYLSDDGRRVASTLREALLATQNAWESQSLTKKQCIEQAKDVILRREGEAKRNGWKTEMRLDYIQMNDAESFDVLADDVKKDSDAKAPVILSGALYVDNTRLIDNILLGDTNGWIG